MAAAQLERASKQTASTSQQNATEEEEDTGGPVLIAKLEVTLHSHQTVHFKL